MHSLLLIFLIAEPTGWGIVNTGVPYYPGSGTVAFNGACYGMVRAEIEYMKMGLDKTKPFSAVTTPAASRPLSAADAADPVARQISKTGERIFIEQFAALAQDYTLRGRKYGEEVYAAKPVNPSEVAKSFKSSGVSDANPQVMILRSDKAAHAVMVRGMKEDKEHVTYKIRDPNYPGEERILRYDKKSGKYEGYPEYDKVQHDNTELPEANKRWLRSLVEGASADDKRLPVWRGKGLKTIDVPPPTATRELNGNMALSPDPEVGGVRLYFDPSIVETENGDEARWKMLFETANALGNGETELLIQPGRELALTTVPLRQILEDASENATLGNLTRIDGYVRRGGELFLLGREDPAYEPIPRGILTVALDEIWRRGRAPAISLDPDPLDAYGEQHVRLEEMEESHRHTEFTAVMLDADYAMKTVLFTDEARDIPGFKSTYRLLQENPELPLDGAISRYWLFPRETAGADVFVIPRGDATVVYIESDVKVLTEKMHDAKNFSMGGGVNPVDEEAARLFTAQYDAIAARWPIFRRLDALFDVAKLAAVLRARGEKDSLLDQIADLAVPRVETRKSYAGIGPINIEGTSFFIGGGCESRRRNAGRRVIRNPVITLAAFEDSVRNPGSIDVGLIIPPAMKVDAEIADAMQAELEINQGLAEAMDGRCADAVRRLDRALLQTGDDTYLANVGLAFRAIAHLGNGDPKAALADIEKVKLDDPNALGLRGLIRLYNGRQQDALADVTAAARMDSDPVLLEYKATVELMTLRWSEFERTLAELDRRSPGNLDAEILRQNYKVMRKISPDMAKLRIEQYLKTPADIMLLLEQGQSAALAGNADVAIDLCEKGLSRIKEATAKGTKLGDLFVKERAWLILISLYDGRVRAAASRYAAPAGGDPEADEKRKNELISAFLAARPDWITPRLVKLGYASGATAGSARDRIQTFLSAVKADAKEDPLLAELGVMLGEDPRAYFGFQLIERIAPAMERDPSAIKDLGLLVKPLRTLFETGPVRHYVEFFAELSEMMAKAMAIAAKHGLSLDKKPEDPALEARVEKELDQVLGPKMKNFGSMAYFTERMKSMPPPKPGSGVTTAQVLAKFYVPSVLAGIMDKLDTMMKDGAANAEERLKIAAVLRADIRAALARVEIEWGSFPAYQAAAAASNALHMFYATSTIGVIESDGRWKKLEERAIAGKLPPDSFIAAAEEILEDALAEEKKSSPTLVAFGRAMGGQMVAERFSRIAAGIDNARPAEDEGEKAFRRWRKRREAWQDAKARAGREKFGLHRIMDDIPLDRTMNVLMAKQLLTILERILPSLAQSAEEQGESLRTLHRMRGRLEMRLARAG